MTSLQAWYDLQPSLRFMSLCMLENESTGKQHFTWLPSSKNLPSSAIRMRLLVPSHSSLTALWCLSSRKQPLLVPSISWEQSLQDKIHHHKRSSGSRPGLIQPWDMGRTQEAEPSTCTDISLVSPCRWKGLAWSKGQLCQHIYSNPLPEKLLPRKYQTFSPRAGSVGHNV